MFMFIFLLRLEVGPGRALHSSPTFSAHVGLDQRSFNITLIDLRFEQIFPSGKFSCFVRWLPHEDFLNIIRLAIAMIDLIFWPLACRVENRKMMGEIIAAVNLDSPVSIFTGRRPDHTSDAPAIMSPP